MLPDWIYRILPFAYILIGVIVAARMEHVIGVVSGVILVAAGLYVWKMRLEHRAELATRKSSRSRAPRSTRPRA